MARDIWAYSGYDLHMTDSFRLPKQPVIYEINTAVFLSELSEKYGKPIQLDSVPDEEWKAIAALPADAVWLMGVWQRSPHSRKEAMLNKDLRVALPDFTEADNIGSAYSIRSYEIDALFGGKEGLAHARKALRRHGLGLILDYVPNHLASDHEWVEHHPEYLIPGTKKDLEEQPHAFTKTAHGIFANAKDPNFPPWTDVLQLNVFLPAVRKATAKAISKVAAQCDGVRCDMAMLLINEVFFMTWTVSVGMPPHTEYWSEVIEGVRDEHPNFTFIAEAYWHSEHHLLELGFDYCYDKLLYDSLVGAKNLQLFQLLHTNPTYQSHLLRFIENHDELRAVRVFKGPRYQAAAFVLATLPGATLYHEGQLEGFETKLPVQLGRGRQESVNTTVSDFYHRLIPLVADSHMRDGIWQLCRGNNGFLRSTKLIAWMWTYGKDRYVCVVNYGKAPAKGRFELPTMGSYHVTIMVGEQTITPKAMIVRDTWLTIELQPWGYTLIQFNTQY